MLKNGFFASNQHPSSYSYECPKDWESSTVQTGHGGPVVSNDNGIWAPSPIPNGAATFVILQGCSGTTYIKQKLTLLKTNKRFYLTFYAVSRPGYNKSVLALEIDSLKIFQEELSYEWVKYTIDFTTSNFNPTLKFLNLGENNSYHTCIACAELSAKSLNISMEEFEDNADIHDDELENYLLIEIRRRKHQRKAFEEIWEHQRKAKQLNIENLKMMLQEAAKDLEEFDQLSKEYLKSPGKP